MANFYTIHPSSDNYLQHPLYETIVDLKNGIYADERYTTTTPIDFEDAMDSYDRVLEVVGEICGDIN